VKICNWISLEIVKIVLWNWKCIVNKSWNIICKKCANKTSLIKHTLHDDNNTDDNKFQVSQIANKVTCKHYKRLSSFGSLQQEQQECEQLTTNLQYAHKTQVQDLLQLMWNSYICKKEVRCC